MYRHAITAVILSLTSEAAFTSVAGMASHIEIVRPYPKTNNHQGNPSTARPTSKSTVLYVSYDELNLKPPSEISSALVFSSIYPRFDRGRWHWRLYITATSTQWQHARRSLRLDNTVDDHAYIGTSYGLLYDASSWGSSGEGRNSPCMNLYYFCRLYSWPYHHSECIDVSCSDVDCFISSVRSSPPLIVIFPLDDTREFPSKW